MADEACFRESFLVLDDFLEVEAAEAMRADIDRHFDTPERHAAETHQVWNYWHVPEMYTYLRTQPDKVIDPGRMSAFMAVLGEWAASRLGMPQITWPYLSLYVPGCRQGIHNDAANGRFAFVYSLTRDARTTSGGRTIILPEGDLFRSTLGRAAAGHPFGTLVEPTFNRLVVFDDRIPHGVEAVEGAMAPKEGRIVLHGHIEEAGPVVRGALDQGAVVRSLYDAVVEFTGEAAARLSLYRGPLVLRLQIGPSGVVADCRAVVDRVIAPDAGAADWEPLRSRVIKRVARSRFPTAAGPTTVLMPFYFGASAPPP